MSKINFTSKGVITYREAFYLQKKIFEEKINAKRNGEVSENIVLFCEHPHVYTIGKSGDENNLLIDDSILKKINATYFKSDRGGDITYHGPGQIVVYPIIDLDDFNLGSKEYIYKLEYLIIDVLKEYELPGELSKGNIGVWLDAGKQNERKICSIGVKISRGITMHGLALNINTDLSYYKHINPCGFIDKGVTSMQKELGETINLEDVKDNLLKSFERVFNFQMEDI